ncbi:MAG TPA: polysaccharide deacetylase family protein [Thermoguttaceae bacterium]|nr:polysaccharide deacetylase family protein [Thermoguttaceae bacterium]
MPVWKQLLLSLYYHGTRPLRWWNLRRAVAERRVPVVVLYYHRVADDRANDWTISNRLFARQIRWLQSHFELISLEEAQRRIRTGENDRPCVSITFDDGYADNCREAIPLLIRERIPCTYFVTLQNVLDGKPFSHDLAEGNAFLPNTLEQLRAMAAAGIEIGAHTRTHAGLATIADPRRLHDEIVVAGEQLQQAVGRPVRHFAFPFGQYAHLSREAFAAAEKAGYEAVCSAYGGFNFPGDDPFHLHRIPADDVMIRLKNWTTLDPRKLDTPRFDYDVPLVNEDHAPKDNPCSAAATNKA